MNIEKDDYSIKIDNLTKIYKTYKKPLNRIYEVFKRKKLHHEYYALKGINLKIKKGETLGIIGRNGAGKSTLLKIISGITHPTSGKVEVNGKVSSLIELGTGFKNDFTGIENIYLNASFLGLTKKEIDQKLDSIIEFADIDNFIYEQLKTYSSGMRARLGFAIAVNVEPDILIVDEALSVGDKAFKEKCFTKFYEFKENESTTLLIVSHSMGSIKDLSDRVLLLHKGELIYFGETKDAISEYQKIMKKEEDKKYGTFNNILDEEINKKFIIKDINKDLEQNPLFNHDECMRYGNNEIIVHNIILINTETNEINPSNIKDLSKTKIRLELSVNRNIEDIDFFVVFTRYKDNKEITGKVTYEVSNEETLKKGKLNILIDMKGLLDNATYYTSFLIKEKETDEQKYIEALENVIKFEVGQPLIETNEYPYEQRKEAFKEAVTFEEYFINKEFDDTCPLCELYNENEVRFGTQEIFIRECFLIDYDNNTIDIAPVDISNDVVLKLIIKCMIDTGLCEFEINFRDKGDMDSTPIYSAKKDLKDLKSGLAYALYIQFNEAVMKEGQYYLSFSLNTEEYGLVKVYDRRENMLIIDIINKSSSKIESNDDPVNIEVSEKIIRGIKRDINNNILKDDKVIVKKDKLKNHPLYAKNGIRYGNGKAEIQDITIINYSKNTYNGFIDTLDNIDIKIIIHSLERIEKPFLEIRFKDEDDNIIFGYNTLWSEDEPLNLLEEEKTYTFYFACDKFNLNEGKYHLSLLLGEQNGNSYQELDYRKDILQLKVRKRTNLPSFNKSIYINPIINIEESSGHLSSNMLDNHHPIVIDKLNIRETSSEMGFGKLYLTGDLFIQLYVQKPAFKMEIKNSEQAVIYSQDIDLSSLKKGEKYSMNIEIENKFRKGLYYIILTPMKKSVNNKDFIHLENGKEVSFNKSKQERKFIGYFFLDNNLFLHHRLVSPRKDTNGKIVDEKLLIFYDEDKCKENPLYNENEIRYGNKEAIICDIEILNRTKDIVNDRDYALMDDIEIKLLIKTYQDIDELVFGFIIRDEKGNIVFADNNSWMKKHFFNIKNDKYYSIIAKFKNYLNTGIYLLSMIVTKNIKENNKEKLVQLDRREDLLKINVTNDKREFRGDILLQESNIILEPCV